MTIEQSANAILNVVFNSTPQANNGKFMNIHVPGWERSEGINEYNSGEILW